MTWFTAQSVAKGSLTDLGLASTLLLLLRVPRSDTLSEYSQPGCANSHQETQAILGEQEQTGVLVGEGLYWRWDGEKLRQNCEGSGMVVGEARGLPRPQPQKCKAKTEGPLAHFLISAAKRT